MQHDNYETLIYGYDAIETKPIKYDTKLDIIGLESYSNSNVPTNSSVATQYFIQGLSEDIVHKLKSGIYYIIFEIEAIDHTKPTANGRLYPKDKFYEALCDYSFQNKLRLGAVPGENEHPLLTMNSTDDNLNKYNSFLRVEHVDGDNSPHGIIGFRQDENKTYFTIKTSLTNLTIVNNLLNGILPAFSIRTRAMFKPGPGGCEEATTIKIIAIDYVRNPSNAGSTLIGSKVTMIDPINFKAIDMPIVSTTGFIPANESIDMDFLQKGDEILVNPEAKTVGEQLYRFAVRRKKKESVSFESVMNDMKGFLM